MRENAHFCGVFDTVGSRCSQALSKALHRGAPGAYFAGIVEAARSGRRFSPTLPCAAFSNGFRGTGCSDIARASDAPNEFLRRRRSVCTALCVQCLWNVWFHRVCELTSRTGGGAGGAGRAGGSMATEDFSDALRIAPGRYRGSCRASSPPMPPIMSCIITGSQHRPEGVREVERLHMCRS